MSTVKIQSRTGFLAAGYPWNNIPQNIFIFMIYKMRKCILGAWQVINSPQTITPATNQLSQFQTIINDLSTILLSHY